MRAFRPELLCERDAMIRRRVTGRHDDKVDKGSRCALYVLGSGQVQWTPLQQQTAHNAFHC